MVRSDVPAIQAMGDSSMNGTVYRGDGWTLTQGDCVDGLADLPDESIDLSVYSPPFISLYTYSASERDIGNCSTAQEFFAHFGFVIRGLLRVTKPGRLSCVHIAQVPAMLERDGYIGMKDFRGQTIEAFSANGWIYHGEVCIDKDPQAQAIRTKSKALLFIQMRKDSSWLRPAMADYILVFRKPGENPIPIQPDLSNNDWIEWARPIWYGIRESDTLQVAEARAEEDERHICPLQLGTIERCIRLWSNPGEVVLSPFAGIGSEGYEAIRLGRQFIGFELKPSYALVASRNLQTAELKRTQKSLFQVAT
jgi:DNA modification methylase